jgi:predicted PurR-regulated permease PerM
MGLLMGAVLWVLRPFLGPGIWAVMVVVATWPLLLRLQRLFGGRRWAAVAAMTLALLLLFVVPLSLAIGTIFVNVDVIADAVKSVAAWRPGETAPDWLRALPLAGAHADTLWAQLRALGLAEVLPKLTPYAGNFTKWVLGEVGSIGFLLLQFLLTVVIASVLYSLGEQAADFAHRFARRLGGERGNDALHLAEGAIRGVALGVGVTALVQSVLGGIGLAVAGVPFAGLLTALMFMLCIAQVGPMPVLLPAAGWLLWGGSTGWGVALVVWALIVGTMDNVLRPALIKLGADLSLLLIFAGVIGGLLAFGLVGLFVGPVVLAVGMRLLEAWMDEDAAGGGPATGG